MLEVQNYLQKNGLQQLKDEFKINVAEHPELPLVILNYDQCFSKPRNSTIVRECRALVLEKNSWDLVARSFPRFFNWGEYPEEMGKFQWHGSFVQEKVDGSLCLLFYHKNSWHGITRGSWGFGEIDPPNHLTWREGFCRAMRLHNLQDLDYFLDRELSYVCEFTSRVNKVVKEHKQFGMHLLTTFKGEEELRVENWWKNLFLEPRRWVCFSEKDAARVIELEAKDDPTFEGLVIKDRNNLRYKVKSPKYLSLHALRGNNGSLFHPKHLIPFVLGNDKEELVTYFPEVESSLKVVEEKVNNAYQILSAAYSSSQGISDQKEFALCVKDKPFAGILFNLRKKYGKEYGKEILDSAWRESGEQILKVLF